MRWNQRYAVGDAYSLMTVEIFDEKHTEMSTLMENIVYMLKNAINNEDNAYARLHKEYNQYSFHLLRLVL